MTYTVQNPYMQNLYAMYPKQPANFMVRRPVYTPMPVIQQQNFYPPATSHNGANGYGPYSVLPQPQFSQPFQIAAPQVYQSPSIVDNAQANAAKITIKPEVESTSEKVEQVSDKKTLWQKLGFYPNENNNIDKSYLWSSIGILAGVVGSLITWPMFKKMLPKQINLMKKVNNKQQIKKQDLEGKSLGKNLLIALLPLFAASIPGYIAEPFYKNGVKQVDKTEKDWRKNANIKIGIGAGLIALSFIPFMKRIGSQAKMIQYFENTTVFKETLIDLGVNLGVLTGWLGFIDLKRAKGKEIKETWLMKKISN